MVKRMMMATLIVTALVSPASAQTGSNAPERLSWGSVINGQPIKISFANIKPETGKIWVGVCTASELEMRYSSDDLECTKEQWLDASEGGSMTFTSVPVGTYAITAFHDDNGNGQMDFDTRGIPFEATGNGKNAKGSFGPPTFDQMKFDLPPKTQNADPLLVTVRLYRAGPR